MYPGISKPKRYEKNKRQDQNIFYVTQEKHVSEKIIL